MLFVGLHASAQVYNTLPTGAKPYGNQLYIGTNGDIIAGTGSAKFRVIANKKYVDSLLNLNYTKSQIDALLLTKAPASGSANYIQNNNTGTPQSASANITGQFKIDNGSGTTNMAAGIIGINNGVNSTLINGGEITLTTASTSDSSSKAATTAFVKRIKGAASGVASLDINGKVPLSQMSEAILGSINYKGSYNISTNYPALPAAAPSNKGWLYIVVDSGIHTPSGKEYYKGDWYTSNGIQWEVLNQTNKVGSVNGMTGAVTGLMDLNSLQTVTARKIFTEYPVFENGAVFLNGSGPSLYNSANTFATSFAYEPGATTNTIYRFRPFPVNTINQIAITRDFEAGATIGASTTGNAATATDAAKWNGNTISSSTPTTGQFIVYNGSNYIPKTITATSPIAFNATTSDISLNVAAAKTALGINDGSTLNNSISGNAGSATQWGGSGANFSTFGTSLAWLVGADSADGFIKPFSFTNVKASLGINDGSALNNSANWNLYEGGSEVNAVNSVYGLGYDVTVNKWKPINKANYKTWLGTSWQDATNVGNQTSNTVFITGGSRPTTPTGSTVAIEYAGGIGNLFSYDYSTGSPKDLQLQGPGGNVGVGKTPTDRVEVLTNTNETGITISKSSIEGSAGGALTFKNVINNGTYQKVASISGQLLDGGPTTLSGALVFKTKYLNTDVNAAYVAPNGNWGFGGITNPLATIHVNGSAQIDQGITLGYSGDTNYISSREVGQNLNLRGSGTLGIETYTGAGWTRQLTVENNGSVNITGNVTANNLTSGTYSPSVTSPTNTTGTTSIFTSMYTRVGNIVSVTGKVTLTKNITSQNSSVKISLPISSNFDNGQDLIGNGSGNLTGENPSVYIVPDLTDKVAVINIGATPTASATSITYHFTYTIK